MSRVRLGVGLLVGLVLLVGMGLAFAPYVYTEAMPVLARGPTECVARGRVG